MFALVEEYHGGFKKTDVHPSCDFGDPSEFGDLDPEVRQLVVIGPYRFLIARFSLVLDVGSAVLQNSLHLSLIPSKYIYVYICALFTIFRP